MASEARPDLTLYQWRQGHARLVKHDSGRLSILYTATDGHEESVPVENPYKLITSLLAHAEGSERVLQRILYAHEDTFAEDHDAAISAGHDLLNERVRDQRTVAAPPATSEVQRVIDAALEWADMEGATIEQVDSLRAALRAVTASNQDQQESQESEPA